jgi:hypothetical protein
MAKGFGPKLPKLPTNPPKIKEKMMSPIIDMINTAKKLGQNIFPNVIFFSVIMSD